MGGCDVWYDEWIPVSWANKGRVQDEQILRIIEHYNDMAKRFYSNIGVYRFRVCLDFI